MARINAGGPDFLDDDGQNWIADSGFENSTAASTSVAIPDTFDDALYQSYRYGKLFNFSRKVPNGQYTVDLYFAEPQATNAGQRRFNVIAEDQTVISDLDLAKTKDLHQPQSQRISVHVEDGRLSLGFQATAGEALVNAIQISAGPAFLPGPLDWETVSGSPETREEAQSFVYDGKMYIVGGYINTPEFEATHRVDIYDPVSGKWSRGAPAPYKVTHAGLAQDGADFWFVGGFIGDFPAPPGTKSVLIYNAESDAWRRGPSIPAARGAGGASIIDRTLYYFSGANKNRTADQDDMWALDLDNQGAGWTKRAAMPNPRNHFGFATVDNKIFVFGGQHNLEAQAINQDDVHYYDPARDRWFSLTSMPRPFSHFTFSTAVYQDRYIITMGGEEPHDVGQPDVFAYDTQTDQWAQLSDLPRPRRAGVSGLIGDTLFMTTGYFRAEGQTKTMFMTDLSEVFA